MHTHIHMRTHTHIHTHIHTNILIYTHIYNLHRQVHWKLVCALTQTFVTAKKTINQTKSLWLIL